MDINHYCPLKNREHLLKTKIIENYSKLFLGNKNTLRYKNYNKSIDIFWFAQKGNSLPGEQNKIYINNNYNNYEVLLINCTFTRKH